MNPSLIKSPTNIPGISDHAIINHRYGNKTSLPKDNTYKKVYLLEGKLEQGKRIYNPWKKNSGWDLPTRKPQITYGRHLKGSCFLV
jgi:hypothetical protein